jgi:hypothetical protein
MLPNVRRLAKFIAASQTVSHLGSFKKILIICFTVLCGAASAQLPFKTVCDLEDEAIELNAKEAIRASLALGIHPESIVRPLKNGGLSTSFLKPRKPHQKLKDFAFKKEFHAGIVDIKFVEGAEITIEDGVLRSGNNKIDLTQINDVIAKHGMTIRPLFTRSLDELKADKECAERRSGEETADLTLWFEIEINDTNELKTNYGQLNSTLRKLNNLAEIEMIELRSPFAPPPRPDIPPTTSNFIPQQTYLKSPLLSVRN